MDKFQIVTLSGIITDPRAGLNYIMSCFFFNKHSQTDLYRGGVISLPKIIKDFGNDTIGISTAIENNLERLLKRYYPIVNIDVSARDDGANIDISLKGQVASNDSTGEVRLDMGYTLSAQEGTFRKIIDELNDEELL